MAEEATETPIVVEFPNGDSPVVSNDVLQHMRRGLFGKSVQPQGESAPVGDLQESSNGSADTDDSRKNGTSFEDKQVAAEKILAKVEAETPVIEEEQSEVVVEETDKPLVEEPMDEVVEKPAVEEHPEQGSSDGIEITEVQDGSEESAEPIEVEPVVTESDVPEVANNSVEEDPVVEAEAVKEAVEEPMEEDSTPAEEPEVFVERNEQPMEEEHSAQVEPETEEPEYHPDDPVTNQEQCLSPPPTPCDVAEASDEQPKEERIFEEATTSSRRARRSVKADETPTTTPRGGRARRGIQKEEGEEVKEEPVKTPVRKVRRGAKTEEQTEEEVEKSGEENKEEDEAQHEEEKVEKTPNTSKRNTRRGHGQAKDEEKEEIEKPAEEETPKRSIRRTGRGKKEENVEDVEIKEEKPVEEQKQADGIEEEAEENDEEEAPKSSKRNARPPPKGKVTKGAQRGKTEVVEEKHSEEVKEDEEKEEEQPKITPKRNTRRSHADSGGEKTNEILKESRKRTTRKGQNKEEEVDENKEEEIEEENQEEEAAPRSTRRRAQAKEPVATPKRKATPKGKKVEKEEQENGEEEPTPKRSLRNRDAKPEPVTPKSAKVEKTPVKSGQRKKPEKEESEEDEIVKDNLKTPKEKVKKGKQSHSSTKKAVDTEDPYDMDSQLDLHPDPLKNVVVSEGMFGSTKYGKIGCGKYTFTEKAAEERIGNLSDLLPKQVNRRSLADLTPGRRRITSATKGTKSAPPARKRKNTESDEDMEVDEPGSSKATPVSRKRKPSPTAATSTSKKQAKTEIERPTLTDDQQWIVDHPPDEHAPIEIGARVYAVFDKVYYPAVVIAERDGLSRYKVSFIEDQLVRDIPAQGIVPLRAVVAEKECFYQDDQAIIMACPNAASAGEWAKAVFTIRLLDNDGEVVGNDIKCPWSKLSLDMNDWKDYIHQKSIEATAVAADNIAHTRTRRSHAENISPTKEAALKVAKTPKSAIKLNKKGSASKGRGSRSHKAGQEGEEDNEEEQLQEEDNQNDQERGQQRNQSDLPDNDIFSGMVFLLTSAQRDGNSSFKKKMLVDFIQERKGLVVEDFNELEMHNDRRPFLISDTYYRTHKYLSALAKGVPCVSHEWIHRCIETEQAVDYTPFVLPAGTSSIDGRLFPAPKNQNTLLAGRNVLIYSGNQLTNPRALNYFNIWEPLVTYMGGNALRGLNDIGRNDRIHIVISDNSVTDSMLERAERDNAWVVTSEWLIHAIIMDELTDPEIFPRFKVARSLKDPNDPE